MIDHFLIGWRSIKKNQKVNPAVVTTTPPPALFRRRGGLESRTPPSRGGFESRGWGCCPNLFRVQGLEILEEVFSEVVYPAVVTTTPPTAPSAPPTAAPAGGGSSLEVGGVDAGSVADAGP